MIPNRLLKTSSAYGKKAQYLRSQAARAYGHTSPDTVPPLSIVEHLVNRKPAIARNTWKQYKNALKSHFAEQLAEMPDKVLAEEFEAAIVQLDLLTSEGALKQGTQTSAKKQKNFKRPDYEKLLTYLDQHVGKHRWARALTTWIRATRITGLRPGEWGAASLEDGVDGPRLVALNAKATNGRGNGEFRTLELAGLTQEEHADVLAMLEMLEGYRAAGVDHAELQLRLGDYMKYATRHCFGKRAKYPSLYSLRHQFSADAKGSGLSKKEVAALLGHGSDATAGTHYARGVSGESTVRVAPTAAEAQRVRSKAKSFRPKPKAQSGTGA